MGYQDICSQNNWIKSNKFNSIARRKLVSDIL